MTSVNELLTIDDPLESLAALQEMRRELDAVERGLIEDARSRGIGWAAIAGSLGVRSRQAAEQRWLRLRGNEKRDPQPERSRRRAQRIVDAQAGPGIARLRSAVVAAHRHVTGPELLKQTLAAAVDAPPGALYDLARTAVQDAGPLHEPTRLVREALDALS
jgi:hypothetical protein